jgi:hypothetical protein
MQLKLDKKFLKNVKGKFGKYNFEVGVLDDKPYRKPKRGVSGLKGQEIINIYAGGPVRQATRQPSNVTVAEVSKRNRENLGLNYLTEPFRQKTSEIIKFTNEFFKLAFGRSQPKRATNLLQAVVRNPILRGDYGNNSALTQKIKGFDRKMIDTAQLFKALKAKLTIRGGR